MGRVLSSLRLAEMALSAVRRPRAAALAAPRRRPAPGPAPPRSRPARRSRGRARRDRRRIGSRPPELAQQPHLLARACSSGARRCRLRRLLASIASTRSNSSKSRGLTWRAAPSSTIPAAWRAARVARASGGSPTCQPPGARRCPPRCAPATRLRARASASRPRLWASGRCCRDTQTADGRAHRPHPRTPRPAPAPPGTPPGGPRRGPPASSASCPPSASPAAFSCALCHPRSTSRSRPCGTPSRSRGR